MPIAFSCQSCGRNLRVKDQLAGSQIYCPDCKSILTVPSDAVTPRQEEPLEVLPAPTSRSADSDAYSARAEEALPKPPRKPLLPKFAEDDESWDAGRRLKKPATPAKTSGKRVGQMVGGVAMMIGAVVWFVLGWWAGRIFFYPPILFIIGIITFFKGLLGTSE